MALWPSHLDPFVSPLETTSPSVLPILLSIPGLQPSVHIGLYLPTSGHEDDYYIALSALTSIMEDVHSHYKDYPVFIRGDANTNPNHRTRPRLLADTLSRFGLITLDLGHKTYHHFTGGGSRDSQLDILAFYPSCSEILNQIICSVDDPRILSIHDVAISKLSLKSAPSPPVTSHPKAPRVPLVRYKVIWDDQGLESYKTILAESLPPLISSVGSPPSPSTMSELLQKTHQVLKSAASASFKIIDLSKPSHEFKPKIDNKIKSLSSQIHRISYKIRKTDQNSPLYESLISKRKQLSRDYSRSIRVSNFQRYYH